MNLRRVGFFRELRHGDPGGPSLRELINPSPTPNEERILAYLRSGEIIASTGATIGDVLDPSKSDVAVLEIATDGVWAWPADLTYYVASYHVTLPDDFTLHLERNGWIVPPLTDTEVTSAAVALRNHGSHA
jgi:hypothetical protein